MSAFGSLDELLSGLRSQLSRATTTQDFQQVGHQSRELLISIAQAVYRPATHLNPGTAAISATDAKGMLGAFIAHDLAGAGQEESRKLVRSAVDLANAVQHDRAATKRDAQLAVESCAAVLAVVAVVAGESIATPAQWEGVSIGSRYFAWDGPALHALGDRGPVPTPPQLLQELKSRNIPHRFGTKAKLCSHLAQGWAQAWETDRHSWRRELLYADDGDQILLVKSEAV
jgi:hypothetical protein